MDVSGWKTSEPKELSGTPGPPSAELGLGLGLGLALTTGDPDTLWSAELLRAELELGGGENVRTFTQRIDWLLFAHLYMTRNSICRLLMFYSASSCLNRSPGKFQCFLCSYSSFHVRCPLHTLAFHHLPITGHLQGTILVLPGWLFSFSGAFLWLFALCHCTNMSLKLFGPLPLPNTCPSPVGSQFETHLSLAYIPGLHSRSPLQLHTHLLIHHAIKQRGTLRIGKGCLLLVGPRDPSLDKKERIKQVSSFINTPQVPFFSWCFPWNNTQTFSRLSCHCSRLIRMCQQDLVLVPRLHGQLQTLLGLKLRFGTERVIAFWAMCKVLRGKIQVVKHRPCLQRWGMVLWQCFHRTEVIQAWSLCVCICVHLWVCVCMPARMSIQAQTHSSPQPLASSYWVSHLLVLCKWCYCSVTQLCPTLCDPMDCNTPGSPVFHCLPEFVQIHVHWVGDAAWPSHPLLPPSPFAFSFSQHQDLFQQVGSLHQVTKVSELQHQSFQWIFSL